MLFEGGVEDVKNDFYMSPEHFHTLMTARSENPADSLRVYALESIVDHELQHCFFAQGKLKYGVGTPFRAVMEAKGQLQELNMHMDPSYTGAYSKRMSFEELHTYHQTLLDDLKFMKDHPEFRSELLSAFRNKLAIYLSVAQTSLMLTTSIQNHLFIGGNALRGDFLSSFTFNLRIANERVGNQYAPKAIITLKDSDGKESILEVNLGLSSTQLSEKEVKKRLSNWTIDIQSLVKSKIVSDLKKMQQYAKDLGTDLSKSPPAISPLNESSGTSSLRQSAAMTMRRFISRLLSRPYVN